jgi:hypothetical protein
MGIEEVEGVNANALLAHTRRVTVGEIGGLREQTRVPEVGMIGKVDYVRIRNTIE